MDSEHRHELKENDLLEFFRNFRQWWTKYGTQTLLVILIAVLAVTAYRYFQGKEARELNAAWSDYAAASTPESLQQVAGIHVNRPGLSNRALLDAADQLFNRAIGVGEDGMPAPADRLEPTDEQRKTLEQAAKLYQRVIDAPQPTEPSLHKLNARMGLASVREALDEWDLAAAQYRAVVKEAGMYRNIALTADRLLSSIDHRKVPIAFPPAPEAEAATEPPTEGDLPDLPAGDGNILVVPEDQPTPDIDDATPNDTTPGNAAPDGSSTDDAPADDAP